MKILPILVLPLITSVSGVTIRVEGYLEGDATPGPELGDTMDYYKFEVLTTGPVRIEVVPGFGGARYHLA
ncbi:MAG: hypothetical protein QNL68_09110 [Akkermansiaceae bacterium]